MDGSNRKRCKKRLILCDSVSSSGSDEVKHLKYRKVLQRITPTRNTSVKKVKNLENVQIYSNQITANSENEIDSESENDFFLLGKNIGKPVVRLNKTTNCF